jgi:hypothetical protein
MFLGKQSRDSHTDLLPFDTLFRCAWVLFGLPFGFLHHPGAFLNGQSLAWQSLGIPLVPMCMCSCCTIDLCITDHFRICPVAHMRSTCQTLSAILSMGHFLLYTMVLFFLSVFSLVFVYVDRCPNRGLHPANSIAWCTSMPMSTRVETSRLGP